MVGSVGRIRIAFRPNWVNGWFLRLFARPYAVVNGAEITCDWKSARDVEVTPGPVSAAAFIRYRGTSAELGTGRFSTAVSAGQTLSLTARNGVMNHTPFTLSAAA